MAAKTCVEGVELGFVEKIDDNWKLLSHFFPSKVGGLPSWLVLKNIPSTDELKCQNCQNPCVFLMQVYSPIESNENCFHRTLLVFVCKDASCNQANDSRNFVVFRCQLPRVNDFYSAEPPNLSTKTFDWSSDYPRGEKYQPLCRVCGCSGPKKCSSCRRVYYCSRQHQVLDWKSGHKQACGQEKLSDDHQHLNKILFPEFDLVTEPEPPLKVTPEKSEEAKLAEYNEFMKSSAKADGSLLNSKEVAEDLDKMTTGQEEKVDEQFSEFKSRISVESQQVLRYQRGGTPLWVGSTGQPIDDNITKCEHCGAPRIFEFQIMPQLLIHLNVDSLKESLDWGTLAVYSCKESCDTLGSSYCKEFIWKQDFTNDK